MNQDRITTPEDLYSALDALTVKAKQGGLGPVWMGLLFDAIDGMLRLEPGLCSPGGGDRAKVNQRGKYRVAARGNGNLVHAGKKVSVEIRDMSAQGFGIHAPASLPVGANVMLEVISGQGGKDLYSCYVQNCRQNDGNYRIGLRIFDMPPCF
ncbi:MAG: PilZ domain-containing protein [Magnetococcales bacterium]|nr:PilZ domain-containing protein [Magnetococcales bacterium]MBF0151298.1 PilZ domain-containing protein [Magnetococcales bacterium]MBF0172032.1 PilZ domain-containing protein [Magnetococcales bacterium]MBF0346146.1 PilZ domain-containing protein [Magnetococcales bacterium]MBF0630362.1 PilZ domain-containing protein [Magnetococcales bacterium]